jgi:hypothetical protein
VHNKNNADIKNQGKDWLEENKLFTTSLLTPHYASQYFVVEATEK